MKRITPIVLGAFIYCTMAYASFSQKQFVVLFPTDSFSLNVAAAAELDNLVECVNGKYFEMMIDAHTDDVGANLYNIELSKKRATSVRDYLVSKGIDEERTQFSWFGESKPAQTNATEEGKQANRRVTVTVNIYNWESAQEILDDISENQQEFNINPEEKAVIETGGGMKIEIPENAFVTANGVPLAEEDITVVLTEALSRESWLQEGLSTVSPEGILESGGMFKIEALQKGEQLRLKEGSDGMSLFYASTDGSDNTVWQKSEEPVKAQLNVELPALDVDMAKLNGLIAKYRGTRVAYVHVDSSFFKLTPQPQFKRSHPRKPKMPVKEEMRINLSGVKSWFKTKKHKDKLIEAAYQRRMKVYDRNLAYYERRLKNYNQKKETFDKVLAEFNERQPEYERQIISAISTMDSLKTAYEKNIANDRIYSCLASLKYKMAKEQITDPDYISNLINSYTYYTYRQYVPYPKELLAIRDKLDELGYSQPRSDMRDGWYYDYEFNKIWSSDKQLMLLLSEAGQRLMGDRLAKGIGSSRELNGYYLTSLSNLGWINIDRLSKMNQRLTASLSIKHDPNSRVFVIFDDINSVLEYRGTAMKVPQNMPMTVFSVTLIDNLPHYAVASVISKQKTTQVELKYKEGLLKDIKSAIKHAV